jgi:hypothetical protein
MPTRANATMISSSRTIGTTWRLGAGRVPRPRLTLKVLRVD